MAGAQTPRGLGRRLLVQEQGDVGMSAQGGAGVVRPDRSGEGGADRITFLRSRNRRHDVPGAQQPRDGDGDGPARHSLHCGEVALVDLLPAGHVVQLHHARASRLGSTLTVTGYVGTGVMVVSLRFSAGKGSWSLETRSVVRRRFVALRIRVVAPGL